jgi:predicted ArsR family transcriptional regulator
LQSERATLGLIATLGPLDAAAVAIALTIPRSVVQATLDRLVRAGLVALAWEPGRRRPWHSIAPQLQPRATPAHHLAPEAHSPRREPCRG